MPNNPLLVFPTPTTADRVKLGSGPTTPPHSPSLRRQSQRLTPKFRELQHAFEARAAAMQDDPAGAPPEQVVVFETVGSVENFLVAVKHTPGMSWLADWAEEEIPQDDDFYIEGEPEELMSGRLYLVMSNQQAIDQLISLFQRFKRDPDAKLDRGLNTWKNLFKQLHDVRRWSAVDRLHDTGILEAFRDDMLHDQDPIGFEAELWCRETRDQQRLAFDAFRAVVEAEGGRCVTQCCVPEIAYHGVLVEAPRGAIQPIVELRETRIVLADQVMFFRPIGQAVVPTLEDVTTANIEPQIAEQPVARGEPTVALLDGLPLENHDLLVERLNVDDPDGWTADSPASSRLHGTAMASLIVRGELDAAETPLDRPIYVRPIMKPDARQWHGGGECVPPEALMVDLLYRAVRRIAEAEGENAPAAPGVRVINLSIGDPNQPFNRYLSSTARLLDWLAYRYNLLFVVSAGNYPDDIELGVNRQALNALEPAGVQAEVLKTFQLTDRNRKMLSPAEAMNVLTVGAVHADNSPFVGGTPGFISPYVDGSMLSPYSRFGPGFRRSIKPEILTSGGRSLYRARPGGLGALARLEFVRNTREPGHRVACPGTRPRETNKCYYTRGTSNAAALATRAGALAFESLLALRGETNGELLTESSFSALLKALIVHGATWGDAYAALRAALCGDSDARYAREYLSRYLGYGTADFSRTLSCTDQQATVLGCGSLGDGEAHVFQIPLPPSLRAQAIWRRLTITLGWNSPINPRSQKYRVAQLWFDTNTDQLRVDSRDAWWQSVRRGTLQHEVREGESATVYSENSVLEVRVNCKGEAGKLIEAVPYGLVVTLEVEEGVEVPIYDEIRTRLYAPVRITPP
jgi:Subtilase family